MKTWVCMLVSLLVYSAQAQWYAKWYEEIQPKQLIPMDVLHFYLNKSQENHFKILGASSTRIIVGGRNAVYNVSISNLKENESERFEWGVKPKEKEFCSIKGKSDEECQNYIGLWVEVDQTRKLVCGTNAYQPLCRLYGANLHLEIPGEAITPHDPNDQSTVIYTNESIYTAMGSDFSGKDRAINRFTLQGASWQGRMRTGSFADKDRLRDEATFVGSLDIDEHIYFFFREFANEKADCRNMVSSRVGRVCKKDVGGFTKHQDSYQLWTSFQKSRLNCSISGDHPFYFDEIQSISDVITGHLVYVVFSSPKNSIPASAVCVFHINDIKAAFDGYYEEDVTSASNNQYSAPTSRYVCTSDSFKIVPESADYFSSHSLMHQYVQPFYGQPIVTHASLSYRLTRLVVDPQVPAANKQAYDILIMATDRGTVIRAVNIESERSFILEETQVFNNGEVITDMKLVPRTKKGRRPRLIVVSKNEIRSVPLGRCSDASRCSECLALHDPYCAWNPTASRCVAFDSSNPKLMQSILKGYSDECPDNGAKIPAASAQTDKQLDKGNNGCYCTLDSTASKCIPFNSTESVAMYNIMKSFVVVNNENSIKKSRRRKNRLKNGAAKYQSIAVWKLLTFNSVLLLITH